MCWCAVKKLYSLTHSLTLDAALCRNMPAMFRMVQIQRFEYWTRYTCTVCCLPGEQKLHSALTDLRNSCKANGARRYEVSLGGRAATAHHFSVPLNYVCSTTEWRTQTDFLPIVYGWQWRLLSAILLSLFCPIKIAQRLRNSRLCFDFVYFVKSLLDCGCFITSCQSVQSNKLIMTINYKKLSCWCDSRSYCEGRTV